MGTWDSGLFDNDHALDVLDELILVKPRPELRHQLVNQALKVWTASPSLWLDGADKLDTRAFMKPLQRDTRALTKLPPVLFELLATMTKSPSLANDRRDRSPEVAAVVGGYRCGWRIDEIFSLPGAMDVVRTVAERNAATIDRDFASTKLTFDELELTELGVLTLFTELGVRHPAARVDAWERGFDAVDARTAEERSFWDEFVVRVRPAFALLREK
jgi:hypothetical protein